MYFYEDSLRPLNEVVCSSIDIPCLSPTYLRLGLSFPRFVTTGSINDFSTNRDSQFDDATKIPHKNNTMVSKPTYLYITSIFVFISLALINVHYRFGYNTVFFRFYSISKNKAEIPMFSNL